MNNRKTILLITRNFPPLVGGMERLLIHTYWELIKAFDVHLVGPSGASRFVDSASFVAQCRLYPTPWFLAQCQYKVMKLALRVRADLVIAGSGVTAWAACAAGKAIGAPVVCFIHGLDLVAKSWLYQGLFVPAIRRCDYFLANSSNTARLAQESGIKPESIRILHPGVTLPYGDVAPDFHDMAGTRGKRILLSVGRLTARKGIVEFVEKCMPEIVATCPDVVLVIIGGEANQALHQKHSAGIREAIVKAAQKMEIETHIRLLGHVSDGLLKAAYMESHLFVFPILELPGDIEGFGIVALEAASFGLPTAAFASGGVQDAVSPNLSGYLVKPSDYKTLTKTIINHFQQHRFKTMRNSSIDFAKNFTWNSFGDELRKACYNFIITK